MNLADYFENTIGTGVLATSNSDGNVDAAIYARPYVIDEKTVAFSMLERLSYANVKSNPKAAYLFIEQGVAHVEEKDPQKVKAIKEQHSRIPHSKDTKKHLMYFSVDKIRPLVGD